MTRMTICLLVGILAAARVSAAGEAVQFEGIVKLKSERVYSEQDFLPSDSTTAWPDFHKYGRSPAEQTYLEIRFQPDLFRVLTTDASGETDDIYQLTNNRLLHYSRDSAAYLVDNLDDREGRVEDFQVLDDTLSVLGRVCRGVQFKLYDGTGASPLLVRCYADSTLYIDPDPFQNLQHDGWGAIIGALHGMPLMVEYEATRPPGLVLRFRAVEIRHAEENERLFWPKPGARVIDNFKH